MRSVIVFSMLSLATVATAVAPVPRKAPEFQFNFADGSHTLLSQYRGKVVMIEFLHTTCPHCQETSKQFSKLYTEFGSQGFQPIGVAWNEMSKMLVPDFIKNNGVNFPVAYSDRDTVMSYIGASVMERVMVPQMMWIDRKGMIRAQTVPAADTDQQLRTEAFWREEIKKLLAEDAGGASKNASHTTSAVHKSKGA